MQPDGIVILSSGPGNPHHIDICQVIAKKSITHNLIIGIGLGTIAGLATGSITKFKVLIEDLAFKEVATLEKSKSLVRITSTTLNLEALPRDFLITHEELHDPLSRHFVTTNFPLIGVTLPY